MNKSTRYFVASSLVTVFVLWYLLSTISLNDIIQLIREADKRYVAFFVVVSLMGTFFRAMRYQLLLSASGYTVPVAVMYLVVLVRNVCVDLLPARLGSLAYVALITTKLNVDMTAAFASWAHEIIFDLIALIPLILICGFSLTSYTNLNKTTLLFCEVILCGAFIGGLWVLPQILSFAAKLMNKFGHYRNAKSPSVFNKIAVIILSCRDEVLRCRRSGIYPHIIVLSILIRVSKYLSLYLFLIALLLPLGYLRETLPPGVVFFGLLSAELTAALPISGIAGIGAYQGMWIAVFTLLGLPLDIAKLTSMSHHIFTQSYAYALGICAAILLALPWIRFSTKSDFGHTASRLFFNIKFASGIILAILFAGIAGIVANYVFASEAHSEAMTESMLTSQAKEALSNLGLDIVFDSNRSGSFGIYRTSHIEGKIILVYDSKSHEMFPDPSPDGKSIVYAESVSLQRNAPSKVFLLDMEHEQNKPRLITENGTFPTFRSDGKAIFFERERNSVWQYDLQTGTEVKVFPTSNLSNGDLSFNGEVVKPRISADRRFLYFTSDTPKRWSSWQVDFLLQKTKFIASGCEAFSGNASGEMVWVKTENAREGSGIFSISDKAEQSKEIVDLGYPRGHEYFPSYGCDGKTLLWSAASPGQHSHETADYQIFIRDEDSKIITQITNDEFTNRWPKAIHCK